MAPVGWENADIT